MNWEAIGATGEILGAGVVLITLAYLAIQIRHAREHNVENIRGNIVALCDDPGFREFWQNGKALYPRLADRVDECLGTGQLKPLTGK